MAKPIPSLERLREVLSYNSETGEFRWLIRCGRQAAGKQAGCLCRDGYVRLSVDGTLMNAQRIAWVMHHGIWPAGDIDHADMNRADNRISNLRLASRSENMANSFKRSTNKSGHKGVSWCSFTGKWVAQITLDGRNRKIGRFSDKEMAAQAYARVAAETWGQFSRS